MRSLTLLRHAYKLTNLTFPHMNCLNYAVVAIDGENKTEKRCFASKASGGELNGDEVFHEAFALISLLRDNSRKVEVFPENLEKFYSESNKSRRKLDSAEKGKINLKDIERSEKNIPHDIRSGIVPQGSAYSLSRNLTNEISETPISSMYLSFASEITNLKKALLNPSNLLNSRNLNDSIISLETIPLLGTYDTTTIPLHLNTLINGTVDIDCKKMTPSQLESLEVQQFNEYLTTLAANLCSAPSSRSYRKYYCTENTLDANYIEKLDDKKNMESKKVDHDGSDEIVEDLLKKYDDFRNEVKVLAMSSTVAGKEAEDKKKDPAMKLAGNAPQEDKNGIELDLLDSQLYKKSLKEAEIKRKQLAKASETCKANYSLRACQSKKSTGNFKINDPDSKCSDLFSFTNSRPEMGSLKNIESETEPSSLFKSGSQKDSKSRSEKLLLKNQYPERFSKCTSEPKQTHVSVNVGAKDQWETSSCDSDLVTSKLSPPKLSCNSERKSKCEAVKDESKDPSLLKSKCSSNEKPNCKSENPASQNPCKVLPKIYLRQNLEFKPKPQATNPNKTCKAQSKSCSKSEKPESKEKEMPQKTFECSSKLNKSETLNEEISKSREGVPDEKKPQVKSCSKCGKPKNKSKTLKCSLKSESKSETSFECNSKPESKLKDPSKIPSITKSNSSTGSAGREDPQITFEKSPEKSALTSKCSAPSKQKGEEVPKNSASTSDCSIPLKPKCVLKQEKSVSSSKCSSTTEVSKDTSKISTESTSKCVTKCSSSSSCVRPQTESFEVNSLKACERAAKNVKYSAEKLCDMEPKNPCKSRCDSMTKPKLKCGRLPRGDTRPRCKKDLKCGSKKPSPCESKEKSESKCGTDIKLPEEQEPSKCRSKTCAPSPRSSKTEIKPKSTCSSGDTKPKPTPSSEPPKRKVCTFPNFPLSKLIFTRDFSDDCPEKPKGGYKSESEKSDEYRRETCENFSWKATQSRKMRKNQPKNCYPEETKDFCPDTACYRVYAERSGKSDKKKAKKKPKGSRENEEALIEKPHKICTRRLTLPEVPDNDALICIDSVALSDTDINMFETGARRISEQLTLGNEAAGVVTEVGRSICNLKVGDHVVLESGIPCFKCDLCKAGHYNLCNNMNFKGFLKNHCVHPASFCHKICRTIPLDHAALIPQLALGCNACYEAGIKPNSNVAIMGSCAMTVCAAICAISMGAENVCVMCGMPSTRVLIEQFVTQKVDCFTSNTIEKGIVRKILDSLGTFPDIVINCAGCTKTMNAAIIALKPAGVCIVSRFLSECVSFNIMDAVMKEIRIIPSFRSKNMFPIAIHLLESGQAPLDCLIANCELCKWNELECAFKLALSEGNNGPRKAIVKCQLNEDDIN